MTHRLPESTASGPSASRDGIASLDATGFQGRVMQGPGPIAAMSCRLDAATNPGAPARQATSILLFDDECAVCRRMANWVRGVARNALGEPTIDVRPIGEDPEALRKLDPRLDIWQVYAKSHLLMPDGSLLIAGEAVAEVLRRSPGMAWCAWLFSVRILTVRPFQRLLDLGYVILSDVRPIFGCKSCGAPALWARPFVWLAKTTKRLTGPRARKPHRPNFTPLAATGGVVPPPAAPPVP